jgi:filamentous hemagglutinin
VLPLQPVFKLSLKSVHSFKEWAAVIWAAPMFATLLARLLEGQSEWVSPWAKCRECYVLLERVKGNFGIGSATAREADELGRAWVGEGHSVASNGTTLISRDGLRQYRPPSFKPNLGRQQANLESRVVNEGQWQSNAHVDVVP